MFFTTGIIITSFCFAFYLIWHQFLRKDTRLSTGLQVLRKKITDLENLSLSVETQVDRQVLIMEEHARKLESLLKTSKEMCAHLENNIKNSIQVIEGENTSAEELTAHKAGKGLEEKPQKLTKKQPAPHLKVVETNPPSEDHQEKFEFGKSPFSNLDFTDNTP